MERASFFRQEPELLAPWLKGYDPRGTLSRAQPSAVYHSYVTSPTGHAGCPADCPRTLCPWRTRLALAADLRAASANRPGFVQA